MHQVSIPVVNLKSTLFGSCCYFQVIQSWPFGSWPRSNRCKLIQVSDRTVCYSIKLIHLLSGKKITSKSPILGSSPFLGSFPSLYQLAATFSGEPPPIKEPEHKATERRQDVGARKTLIEFGKYVGECLPKYIQKIQVTHTDELELLIHPQGIVPVTYFLKNHHNAQFTNIVDIAGMDVLTRKYRSV